MEKQPVAAHPDAKTHQPYEGAAGSGPDRPLTLGSVIRLDLPLAGGDLSVLDVVADLAPLQVRPDLEVMLVAWHEDEHEDEHAAGAAGEAVAALDHP